jgi:hypothetical protein
LIGLGTMLSEVYIDLKPIFFMDVGSALGPGSFKPIPRRGIPDPLG